MYFSNLQTDLIDVSSPPPSLINDAWLCVILLLDAKIQHAKAVSAPSKTPSPLLGMATALGELAP